MPIWRDLGLRTPLTMWKPWRVGIWGSLSTNISSFSILNSRSSGFVPPASPATNQVIVTMSSNITLVIVFRQSTNPMSLFFFTSCVNMLEEKSKSWEEKLNKSFGVLYIYTCESVVCDSFMPFALRLLSLRFCFVYVKSNVFFWYICHICVRNITTI